MAVQFEMTMRMTQFFLDRQEVAKSIGKANRRAMSKVGSFIRRRARSSLRRRKHSSLPGQPPSVHSRSKVATLKNILFAYDPQNETLVVGPVRLNQSSLLGPQLGSATVPQVMEFGDTLKSLIDKNERGAHGYMPNAGFDDVREAVAGRVSKEQGVDLPQDSLPGLLVRDQGVGDGHAVVGVDRVSRLDDGEGERLSDLRLEEALATGASVLVTSCPYCIAMLEDSVRTLNVDHQIQVKDLTELVCESLGE